ncbi:unnamed protein product [Microthlaspi erraticum]|uniref:F-box associated beta-propeller type 1 domain-containing protein n=1 Tax=Microthlaspi erraticum TaxID=1685480 RepID=A0A6D2JPA1_9BRAS|nr:unnamed protein product [Microthlaspi erraticum]
MPTVSDLSEDLVGEIFATVPFTSLKAVSTCKNWNALYGNQVFGKGSTTRKQFLGFTLIDYRVYSMKFDLQGILNDHEIGGPSIKQVSVLGQVEIYKLFHCNGLVLCVTKDHPGLLVWNPYLGKTRWIRPLNGLSIYGKYAFGYSNINGYPKILRIYVRKDGFYWSEIYDCNSKSWRVLGVTPEWHIKHHQSSMSLNGNTYFLAHEYRRKDSEIKTNHVWSLLSFDFTAERFGPLLPLPFQSYFPSSESVALSCVRDEQLALLYLRKNGMIMEIWTTTKIDPNSVSWSMFLKVDTKPLPPFPGLIMDGTFFIDEAHKKVVVSSFREYRLTKS